MATFDLNSAIDKLEVGKAIQAKTAPVVPSIKIPTSNPSTTPQLSNSFQRFLNPVAQSDVQNTPDDTGSKYDTGYINQLDLGDYRADNQSGAARLGEGVVRTLGGAVLKLGEGISVLGSALGVGGVDAVTGISNLVSDDKHQQNYMGLSEITDNPVNNFIYGLEDDMKKELPIYKNQNFNDLNLLQQMGTTAWWADEGADVLGFALSNLIPAGAIGKLGLGAKAVGLLGATMDIAEDAAGIAKTSTGMFAKVASIGDSIGKMGKMGELANDILIGKSGLGNPVKFAKSLDALAQNAYMTTSEAYFMTRDAGTTVTNNYLQQAGVKSVDELNPEQQKDLIAKKAQAEQYTFWSNMAALSFASKVETGFINKIFGHATPDAVSGLVQGAENMSNNIAPIERNGISKFFNETRSGAYLKNIPKYAATEGLYKANIQNSIQTVATQFGYTGKLDYIEHVLSTATSNLTSADAYKAMGANLIVGTLMGAYGGGKELSEQNHAVQRAVTNVNSAKENMVNLNNTLYEKNSDGTTKVDGSGRPVYNIQALTDYAANTQQVQDLSDLHDYFKAGGDEHTAQIMRREAFTKYALAHLEAGLGDELTAKVKALEKYSDDDLAKLGYDPIEIDKNGNKIAVADRVQELLNQSNQIKQDYQRISRTVNPIPENNARINEAVKILSRARTLEAIHQDLTRENADNLTQLVKQNPLIAEFNNKAEQLEASKNSYQQGLENGNLSTESASRVLAEIKEREANLLEEKRGMAEELHKLGYRTNSEDNHNLIDISPIKSEIQESPEYQNLVQNHQDIEDTKIARRGQIDNYNKITNFKDGADNFNKGIVASKMANILRNQADEHLNDTTDNQLAQYKAGNWIRNGEGKLGQLQDEGQGSLSIDGKPFDREFIKNNPDIHKLSEEEAREHLANIHHQNQLNEVQDNINTLKQKQEDLKGSILDNNLKQDIVGTDKARVSEKELADQIASINEAKDKLKDNPEAIQKLNKALSLLEGLQKKVSPQGISDNPTSDAKDIDLNKKQTNELRETLASLDEVRQSHEDNKAAIDENIKDLELQHSKLSQQGPLISEHEVTNNPPVQGGEIKAEDIKPTINNVFKTAGSHFPTESINNKSSQKAFFKFAEEFNPKVHKGYKLRTVTINDSAYGLNGASRDLFREDDPKYHTENNIKILVVDKKGNPILKNGEHIYTSLNEIRDEQKELEHFKWSNGENMFRTLGSRALDMQAIEDYRAMINNIKQSTKPVFLEIKGKSNGVQITGEAISAEKAFGKEKGDLRIITDRESTIGGKDFRLPQGLLYFNYRGRPVGATLRTLTKSEVSNILQKLKDYASKRGTAEGVNSINELKTIIYLGERGLDDSNSIFFVKGKDALSFGDNLINHEDLTSGKYDEQLTQFLEQQNHQVDRKTLENNQAYTDISGKQWKNYQEYLLKDRGEETPLRFEIQPQSNDIDKPQFKNTYLTFNNPKTESESTKVQEEPSTAQSQAEATTAQPYVRLSDILNQTTENDNRNPNPTREEEIIKSVNEQRTNGKTSSDLPDGKTSEDRVKIEAEQLSKDIEGDDLFNLNKDVVTNYTKSNPEEEEKWFKENISTILSYDRVKSLIDGKAYGKFEKAGRVLVSDLATTGTSYHEGFHVVTQLYLKDSERQELYKNYRDENPQDKDLADKQVEEKLAEEFREFMLSDYSSSNNKSIFQKIVDFIKNLIGLGDSEKEKLFQNIGDGKYLDNKIQSSAEDSMYSVAKAFSASIEKDLFNSMTLALLQNMQKNNFTVTDLLRFANNTLNTEDTARFTHLYNVVNETMVVGLNKAALKQSNGEFLTEQVIPYIRANSGQIALDHMKYLGLVDGRGKVNFRESLNGENTVEPIPENEKQRDTLGIIDSIEFSPKSTMPNVIKLMIASLPKTGIDSKGDSYIIRNNLGLPTISDYKRNINILVNELAGLSSLKDQITKVNELRLRIPEFKRLLEQLGVNGDGTVSPTATSDQFDLQSKFRQQFDKNHYTFYTQLFEGNNSYMLDSNTDKLENIIRTKWQSNIIANKNSVKSVNGNWILNKSYFKDTYDKSLEGEAKEKSLLSFYKDLGITFSRPDLLDIDELADKQRVLLNRIETEDTVSDIFEGTTGWINALIQQELNSSFDYGDNQHINPEGKTVYNVSLNDYLSQTVNDINKNGFPKHLQWDEQTKTGNPLVRNSIWKGLVETGTKIKTAILEGSRINEQGEQGQSTARLSSSDAASQQFTAIMNGIYPFMRASDKSLEKGFTFDSKPKYVSLEESTDRFTKYLSDEMLRSWMLNVENIGKEFPEYAEHAKDLTIFKNILNEVDNKTKDSLISKLSKRIDAIKQIDDFVKQDTVKKSIQDWLERYVKENIKTLEDKNLIQKFGNTYSLLGIPSEVVERIIGEQNNLSEAQLHDLVEQFTIHQLTSNIEQTKLFTGDPAFYNDFFKRTSGLVGTGKTAWTGGDVDEWLNTNRVRNYKDRDGEIKIDKQSNGKLKYWLFNDIKTRSSNLEEYISALKERGMTEEYARKLLSAFNSYDEADAQSYMTLPEYREFLSRVGDWTNSHEAIFEKLTNGERLNPRDLDKFFGYVALKPQGFGPEAEANEINAPTFLKTSIMPLIPSVIEGKQLEELMHTMHENGTGLAIFKSGSKVANKEANELYDGNGKIKLADNLNEQSLDYKHLKIQLDIAPETKDKVILGTQYRKIILSNLANKTLTINGKTIQGNKLIAKYSELINKAIELETNRLIDKLGLDKLDENTYKIANPEALRTILSDEAFSRNSPDNVINGIKEILPTKEQIEEGKEVKQADVLVNRNKIENILMSIVDNNLTRQQVFGDSRVQGASTGFEPSTAVKTLADAKTNTWWSKVEHVGEQSNLKFYQPHPEGTRRMEVYLPHYFKEYLGKNIRIDKLDSRLLEMVGFRTPTSGMSDVDLITIKGFLPQEAGNMVVVPSEIVAKSGSDFDIDKLSLMFNNYIRDEHGNLNYLDYKGNENNIKAIHNRLHDIASKIISAPENFEQLISPTSSRIIKEEANLIARLKPEEKSETDNGRGSVIGWAKNLAVREQNLEGKQGIAQTALHNVHHILSQIVGLKAKPNVKIYLQHNETEGQVDFSKEKAVNNTDINSPSIMETIKAFVNSFVDAAKDPFLHSINANTKTIGTYLYLIRAGVPLRQAMLFMNQPIITDFLKAETANNSQFLRATDNQLFPNEVEKNVRDKYDSWKLDMKDPTIEENYSNSLTDKKLADNIRGNLDKSVQQQILTDFLNYRDAAEKLSDLIKATTPDTRGPGATMNSAQEVLDSLEELKDKTIFENVDKFIDDTFLSGFQNVIKTSLNMFKPLFFTEINEAKQQVSSIKEILKLNKFSDREKALNTAKNDLINYALQTTRVFGLRLDNKIKELFTGENSLPKQIAKARENSILKDNLLIRELYPIISKTSSELTSNPQDLDNLKTFNKRLDTVDSNLVTEAWKELFKLQPELAENTMIFSILQSGLNNSPISFMQYIPNEEYIPIADGLLKITKQNPNFEDFSTKFLKNNYRNNDLVPRVKRPGWFGDNLVVKKPSINTRTGEPDFLDRTQYPIVKVWNKLTNTYDLYQNTNTINEKGSTLFEKTNKLGDGYNLKEWGDRSIIASNNLNGETNTEKSLLEDGSYNNARIKFSDMVDKRIDLSDEQKDQLESEIQKANSDEDFAKLLKKLCE